MNNMKQLLGERPLLVMYRDCLKAVPLMNENRAAQANIQRHFRLEFEKMRVAQTEDEVKSFKEGIVRMLSNLTLMQVKQQYLDNKEMFDNHAYSIHDHSSDDEADVVSRQGRGGDDEGEDKEQTKEESAAKFPFF